MSLRFLGTSILGNMLTGTGIMRAGKGIVRTGAGYNYMDHTDKKC